MAKEIDKEGIIPTETTDKKPVLSDEVAEQKPKKVVDKPILAKSPETESVNSNKEWVEWANKYVPGADVSSPQAILDALKSTFSKMVKTEGEFIDLVHENPEAGATLLTWKETGSLPIAIAQNYDPEEISGMIDEINDESMEEHRKKYSEKVKNRKDYEGHRAKNRELTRKGAEEFLKEVNPSEKEQAKFITFADTFLQDASDEKLTKDRWMALWQAFRYSTDVSTAEENGKIVGRNSKIVSEKKTKDDLKGLLPEGEGASVKKVSIAKRKSYADDFMQGVFD